MSMGCPACGSNKIVVEEEQRTFSVPYGPSETIWVPFHNCQDCTMAYFVSGGDQIIVDTVARLDRKAARMIIEDLEKTGLTMVYMERALRLPFGIMKFWKEGERLTPEGMAMLRMIRTYPELIQVSDNEFKI